jgi:hemolysin activation/secretion protein
MFRRRVVVRRGPGLLGTAAVGGLAYAAGSSRARQAAQDQQQSAEIAQRQAQQEQQEMAAQVAQPPPPAAQPQPAAPAPAPATTDEKIRQLQELAKLKDAGVLNDEELAREKQRILAGG